MRRIHFMHFSFSPPDLAVHDSLYGSGSMRRFDGDCTSCAFENLYPLRRRMLPTHEASL
jgi:hypothetical protein